MTAPSLSSQATATRFAIKILMAVGARNLALTPVQFYLLVCDLEAAAATIQAMIASQIFNSLDRATVHSPANDDE
jgi:hypothetical protein